MPLGVKPYCTLCNATSSTIWRKSDKGDIVCNSCGMKGTQNNNNGNNNGSSSVASSSISSSNNSSSNGTIEKKDPMAPQPTVATVVRKSTRNRTGRNRLQVPTKSSSTKGKGRRVIFKKSATKAPSAVATPVTTNCVFYKGSYFQIGDIISMLDVDGDVYYAQIRGLLQDQYCEKSAVITWLIPTQSSPKDRFDPSTYILGPEEEIPRKLECMEFICHAPSDYYKAMDSPYPTISHKPEACFIWTRLRPHIKPIKRNEDIYSNPF